LGYGDQYINHYGEKGLVQVVKWFVGIKRSLLSLISIFSGQWAIKRPYNDYHFIKKKFLGRPFYW